MVRSAPRNASGALPVLPRSRSRARRTPHRPHRPDGPRRAG